MVDVILEQENCPSCGQEVPAPADGQWRWARGAKDHGSIEAAERVIRSLKSNDRFEFRAAVDGQGRVRIASRRKPA